MKKVLAIILVVLLVTTAVTACGTTNTPSSPDGTTSTTTGETVPNTQRVSVNIWAHDMDFPDDDRLIGYIEDKFNLDLNFTTYPNAIYQENLRIELSAGNVPDMFPTEGPGDKNTMYDQLYNEGLLTDLTDVLPNYPNLAAQLDYDTDMIYALKNGDRLFGVPRIWNKDTTDRVYYIRQDWLDELGLEIPDTWDDLNKTLLAFKEAKPGGQEQVGLTTNHWAWLDMLVYPGFTGVSGGFYKDSDGLYKASLAHPKRKEAVEYLAKLYTEGVLDPEIFVHNESRPLDYFSTGRSGVVMQTSQYAVGYNYFDQTLKNFPDAKIAIINPIMANSDGVRAHHGIDSGYYGMWVFNKEFPHTERVLEMMDWLASEEGTFFVRNGIEGIHYTLGANGEIVKNEVECEKDQFNTGDVTSHYVSYFTSIDFTFNRDMTLPYAEDLFVPSDEIGAKYSVRNVVKGVEYDDQMIAAQAAIDDIVLTQTSQMITGQVSIDEYDTMVKTAYDLGLDYIEEQVNIFMASKGK